MLHVNRGTGEGFIPGKCFYSPDHYATRGAWVGGWLTEPRRRKWTCGYCGWSNVAFPDQLHQVLDYYPVTCENCECENRLIPQ